MPQISGQEFKQLRLRVDDDLAGIPLYDVRLSICHECSPVSY